MGEKYFAAPAGPEGSNGRGKRCREKKIEDRSGASMHVKGLYKLAREKIREAKKRRRRRVGLPIWWAPDKEQPQHVRDHAAKVIKYFRKKGLKRVRQKVVRKRNRAPDVKTSAECPIFETQIIVRW